MYYTILVKDVETGWYEGNHGKFKTLEEANNNIKEFWMGKLQFTKTEVNNRISVAHIVQEGIY